MSHMLPRDMQLANEHKYSRKFIDKYIDKEIRDNPDMEARVQQGVSLLETWLQGQYYDFKMARLAQLQDMELEPLVREIFIQIAYCQRPELFVSVTAQLSGRLKMNDRREAIQTIAEMVAVLCETDAFDILKPSREASLQIQSRIPLSDRLMHYIWHSQYLPPMVCAPRTLTQNWQSAYLTHNDSLILGKGNHHDGDICLDVLNLQNQIPLRLSVEFLKTLEEEPTFVRDTPEKAQQWQAFKETSYHFYTLMVKQGNQFYITNKVDKRGRMYCQGYHISYQGTAFKKAMVELAEGEYLEGMPA